MNNTKNSDEKDTVQVSVLFRIDWNPIVIRK